VNLENILTQLKSERDRLDKAISALAGVAGRVRRGRRAKAASSSARPTRRRRLSPEGRRRIVEALKRRWAQQKKKAA
jgi:hypothetical protein